MDGWIHYQRLLNLLTKHAATIGLITALAAIVVSPLANFFIVRYQTRRSFISPMREKWISELRNEIAEYCASAYSAGAISATQNAAQESGYKKKVEEMSALGLASIPVTMKSLWRINMLLNLEEEDHRNLYELLEPLMRLIDDRDKFIDQRDLALNAAQKVLRAEWKRASQGK